MSSKANERHSNKPKLSMAFFAVSKQVVWSLRSSVLYILTPPFEAHMPLWTVVTRCSSKRLRSQQLHKPKEVTFLPRKYWH